MIIDWFAMGPFLLFHEKNPQFFLWNRICLVKLQCDFIKSFPQMCYIQNIHTHNLFVFCSYYYCKLPIFAKAELPLEGIFFPLSFLPWEFLSVKKLEIEKTKTTKYTTFKTDMIKVVLVFSISNFFSNKNSQGRKLSSV